MCLKNKQNCIFKYKYQIIIKIIIIRSNIYVVTNKHDYHCSTSTTTKYQLVKIYDIMTTSTKSFFGMKERK